MTDGYSGMASRSPGQSSGMITISAAGPPSTQNLLRDRLSEVCKMLVQAHEHVSQIQMALGTAEPPSLDQNKRLETASGVNSLTMDLRGLALGLGERLSRIAAEL